MKSLLKILSEIKVMPGGELSPQEIEWLKQQDGLKYYGDGDSSFSEKPMDNEIVSESEIMKDIEKGSRSPDDLRVFKIICRKLQKKPFLSNDIFGVFTPPKGLFECKIYFEEDEIRAATSYIDSEESPIGAFDSSGTWVKISPYDYDNDGYRIGEDEDED